MSTFTRARSRRQRDHMGSRSESHAHDKAAAQRRQAEEWIRVPGPMQPSPQRSWPLKGHEAKYEAETQTWTPLHGEDDLGQLLATEAARRSYYIGQTLRDGKPRTRKRPVGTPIEIITTTFSPPLNDWVHDQFLAGENPRPLLAKLRDKWLARACSRLEGKREVLAMAVHCDTSNLHIDIACSRVDSNGNRIAKSGLSLCGPWMAGVDRQRRFGAKISADKAHQFENAVANFRRRYGPEAISLDVLLARDLDDLASQLIGPPFNAYITAYAAKVPALEAAHRAAALAVLDSARAKLAPPSSEPSQPDSCD